MKEPNHNYKNWENHT